MLDAIVKPFKQVDTESGVVTWFDADSLAEYIASSGDITHPLTRTPLSKVEILRLHHATGIELHSAVARRVAERREQMETENLRDFLEGDVTSVVQAIIDDATDPAIDTASAMLRCRLTHAGRLEEAVANLQQSDERLAREVCERANERILGTSAIVHPMVVHWATGHIRSTMQRSVVREIAYSPSIAGMQMLQFFNVARARPRTIEQIAIDLARNAGSTERSVNFIR